MENARDIIVVHPAKLEKLVENSVRAAVRQSIRRQSEDMRELKEELYVFQNYLTHKQVARDYFDGEVTPETVIRYIREEGLPATKRGRLWFIKVEDLEAWIEDGCRP